MFYSSYIFSIYVYQLPKKFLVCVVLLKDQELLSYHTL